MTDTPQKTVTQLLHRFNREQPDSSDELFREVYDQLYVLAKKQRNKWSGNYTLNTTSLLHEAYLKLVDQDLTDHQTRAHFYATAAKAMRHILINYARDQSRQKRGGEHTKVTLDEWQIDKNQFDTSSVNSELLISLEEALKRLENMNPTQSKIIEYRFFGGMNNEDTALALGVSVSTVKRGWNTARLWLYREMKKNFES